MMASEVAADGSTKDTDIGTFIFLDFESTDLLRQKPRITELCLLAVSRIDMLGAGTFPRVTNKLCLCLNPQKPISLKSNHITGLYNDNLEHQQPFSGTTAALINSFIGHLSQPVCLLAHNGNQFDFPLLAAQLNNVNQSLDPSLLCADTLETFRSLDGLPLRYTPDRSSHNTVSSVQITPARSSPHSTSPPPVVKRKAEDVVIHKDERKISKLSTGINTTRISSDDSDDDCKIVHADKVKKRLAFDNSGDSDVPMDVSSTTRDNDKDVIIIDEDVEIQSTNTGSKDNKQPDLVFSQSWEDDDYLTALDEAEQVHGLSATSSNKSENTNGDDQPREPCKNGSKQRIDKTGECENDSTNTSTRTTPAAGCSRDVSYVSSGSGYVVRKLPDQSTNNGSKAVPTTDRSGSTSPNNCSNTALAGEASTTCSSSLPETSENNGIPINERTTVTVTSTCSSSTSTNTTQGNGASPAPIPRKFKFKSYKLVEIHKRVFGAEPPEAHRAEDDCITLVRVAKATPGFMDWVGQHAVTFSSIPPGY